MIRVITADFLKKSSDIHPDILKRYDMGLLFLSLHKNALSV